MKDKKLHSIKKTGFKVPKDYFDTLDEKLYTEAKLKVQSSSSGFIMPEHYLNELENTIIGKVTKAEPKVFSLFSKRKLVYISGVAAAILLLFTLTRINSTSYTFDSLDTETVENYIFEEDVIDSYALASLMTEEELIESNFIDVNFDEENIETFLLNNLDVEDLLVD